MSEASNRTRFAAVFFVIRPFFLTKDYAPRLFDEPALMVDEMTQLGLKHIMFQALRGWDPKIHTLPKGTILRAFYGLCFIIFPNLEMTKRSSHPDHQLTSPFCSHPWCWERLHFGDIFTSKVIS